MYFSETKNWGSLNKTTGAKVMHCYTDGSGHKGWYGADIYGHNQSTIEAPHRLKTGLENNANAEKPSQKL